LRRASAPLSESNRFRSAKQICESATCACYPDLHSKEQAYAIGVPLADSVTQPLSALEFVETPVFSSFVKRDLGEEGLRALQADLLENPELAPIIPGSGGARKLRWAAPGKGKRGGFRIIYYFALPDQQCFLLLGFRKGEQENLTPDQTKTLREYIKRHLT